MRQSFSRPGSNSMENQPKKSGLFGGTEEDVLRAGKKSE
jgi:hypothetical protein